LGKFEFVVRPKSDGELFNMVTKGLAGFYGEIGDAEDTIAHLVIVHHRSAASLVIRQELKKFEIAPFPIINRLICLGFVALVELSGSQFLSERN
jgi:hypothetical protein